MAIFLPRIPGRAPVHSLGAARTRVLSAMRCPTTAASCKIGIPGDMVAKVCD